MSTEAVPLHERVSGEMVRAILRTSTNELLATCSWPSFPQKLAGNASKLLTNTDEKVRSASSEKIKRGSDIRRFLF